MTPVIEETDAYRDGYRDGWRHRKCSTQVLESNLAAWGLALQVPVNPRDTYLKRVRDSADHHQYALGIIEAIETVLLMRRGVSMHEYKGA